jgi:transcriptional regulator with XRE-family HTH domain
MSKPKTTIALVRKITGLYQKEMAELLGCSMPTIQSLEIGRLKPSVNMATRISLETGVSLKWVLDGKVSIKPTAEFLGGPFTRQTYEETQAAKANVPDLSTASPWLGVALPLTFRIQRLCAILASANETNKFKLCSYKIDAFLDELEKEFGADKVIEDQEYYFAPNGKMARIPEIIDVMPIIEAFHERIRKRAALQPTKRKAPRSPSDMPEKPVSDDYRVTLRPIEKGSFFDIPHTAFRRKTLSEVKFGSLCEYVPDLHSKPTP